VRCALEGLLITILVVGEERAIRTTVVGSYPVPNWLRNQPSTEALDDAIRVVLSTQEQVGIDLPSDGELGRFDIDHPQTNGMIEHFVRPLGGVRSAMTRTDLEKFAQASQLGFRRRPAAVVVGEIDEGQLDLPRECGRIRALWRGPLKFTVTSPYMLGRMVLDEHYQDLSELVLAIARVLASQVREIDADVLQVDEANLPGNPRDWSLAAEAINLVLAEVRGKAAVHVCYGNYGGSRIQQGQLNSLASFFDAVNVDHVVLEMARYDFQGMDMLHAIEGLSFGIGVIDIKDTEVETPSQVARRIEKAARILGGLERIAYVNPDCGFWVLPRMIADRKMEALVRGRDEFEGRS
jgi:5-methyltetrahydropteroyltriglutamate--homocysteine methyltransferase